jgi:hypothetical protein
MKKAVYLFFLVLITLYLFPEVINKDKPLKGQWDFGLSELHRISGAGSQLFANIGSIVTDNGESVYVMDRKLVKIHIFNREGKYRSSFGQKGEGPGEIRRPRGMALKNGNIIVFDTGRIHYFTSKGTYKKSYPISRDIRPRFMKDTYTLVSVPRINWQDPKGMGRVILYNLQNQQKRTLMEFATFKKGMVRKTSSSGSYSFSMSHSALTPLLILALHQGKFYYGMSNRYRITIADENMKEKLTFSLNRKKQPVPAGFKDKVLEGIDFPDNIKKMIKKGFPDHLTFFYRIFVDKNGMIYTLVPTPLQENRLQLDVFSPTGRYLYKAAMAVAEDRSIEQIYWKGDTLYLGLETAEGDLFVSKYRLRLPPR